MLENHIQTLNGSIVHLSNLISEFLPRMNGDNKPFPTVETPPIKKEAVPIKKDAPPLVEVASTPDVAPMTKDFLANFCMQLVKRDRDNGSKGKYYEKILTHFDEKYNHAASLNDILPEHYPTIHKHLSTELT